MPVCADMWIGTSFQRLNFKGTRDVRVDIEPKQVGSGNERSILQLSPRGSRGTWLWDEELEETEGKKDGDRRLTGGAGDSETSPGLR